MVKTMRKEKVECTCCGHWIVPRVLLGNDRYLGGTRIGSASVIASICPFCLSEDWDGKDNKARRLKREWVAEFWAMLPLLVIFWGPILFLAGTALYLYLTGFDITRGLKTGL